jgi:outer membrane autotransporter protein
MPGTNIITNSKLLPQLSFVLLASFSWPTFAAFQNVESMLEAYAPVASPQINDLIIAIDALAPAQRNDAFQTLIPVVDGALRAAIDGPMRQMISVIGDRVLAVQQEKQNCGCVDVYTDCPKGVWGQLLGDIIDQEDVDNVPGYSADVVGGIIGRDMRISSTSFVGVAAGYEYAKVDSFGPSGSYMDIKRYHGSAYGRVGPQTSPFYILGVATLARNDFTNHRKILVPGSAVEPFGISRIAEGEFSGWETNLYLEQGYDCKKNNFHIIPKLMLNYSYLNPESYNEHDALGLSLNVKYESMEVLELGTGLELQWRNLYPQAYVNPEVHGYVFYDFIRDEQEATASFLGGGYPFLNQGVEPASTRYEVGVGLVTHSYRHTYVKFQYDYVAKSDYHRNQAFIKLRHEWG